MNGQPIHANYNVKAIDSHGHEIDMKGVMVQSQNVFLYDFLGTVGFLGTVKSESATTTSSFESKFGA